MAATALAALAGVAFAVCVPTVYTVTSSAPPPLANWTDTSGALWTPAGGFPGCAPGDTAADTNATPTTLIVNSAIPNPIIALNLACPGCVIDVQPGGQLTLAGAGSVSGGASLHLSGGTLVIANGGSLSFAAGSAFSMTAGTLDVQTGGSLTAAAGFIATGTLHLNGTITAPGVSVDTASTLDGSGQVTGDLSNDGTIAPGTSPGTLTVTGNFFQTGGGTLAIEIGGPSAGQFDVLSVGGTATLAGTLTATLINGYVPTTGTTWSVMSFGSRSGDFGVKSLPPSLGSAYTPATLDLTALTPAALQRFDAD